MKKTTISILAISALLGTATVALSFGGGPGGPGAPMMFGGPGGPGGPGSPMMFGGPGGMGAPMMGAPGRGGMMMRGPSGRGGFMGRQIFTTADANKDGVVTREEALAAKGALFAKFDANKDGVVDSSEIDKGLEDRLNQMRTRMRYMLLARLDANGDGKVSKAEFDKPGMQRFDMVDVNNDGKITRGEVQALGGRARGFMRHGGSRWHGGKTGFGPRGAW